MDVYLLPSHATTTIPALRMVVISQADVQSLPLCAMTATYALQTNAIQQQGAFTLP